MLNNKILFTTALLFGFFFSSVSSARAATYYVSANTGNNNNPGTEALPWSTYQRAINNVVAGSIVVVRGGTYSPGGTTFKNNDVTFKNYPGEQVIIQLKDGGSNAFNCYNSSPKTGIKILGSDVAPVTLANGTVSKKGIVVTDAVGSQRAGFLPEGGCSNWEVAGVDFIDVGSGIFTMKQTTSRMGNYSVDNWHVHDNRVLRHYRENSMQFNGNNNIIENNEFSKGVPALATPFGCYELNILGHGNIVRGNTMTGLADQGVSCSGIMFEWSQSDANLIENNTLTNVKNGVEFQGGDNNIIRNNTINAKNSAISIQSYTYPDPPGRREWPCSDYIGSWDTYPIALIPPNDTAHPDYQYYYPYGECESYGAQIIGNKLTGGAYGISFSSYVPTRGTTTITGNTITAPSGKSICNLSNSCGALPANVLVNASPAASPSLSPSASPSPSGKPGDANGNAKVDGVDYVVWLNNYGKTIAGGPTVGDFNSSGKVDGVDYVLWVNNYGR